MGPLPVHSTAGHFFSQSQGLHLQSSPQLQSGQAIAAAEKNRPTISIMDAISFFMIALLSSLSLMD